MTLVSSQTEISRFCSARIQHDELCEAMRRDTREVERERKEVLTRVHSAMDAEGVTCVSTPHGFVTLKLSGACAVDLDVIIETLRAIDVDGDCLPTVRPRNPQSLSRAVAQAVRKRVRVRTDAQRRESGKTTVQITPHRPRDADASKSPSQALDVACVHLAGAHDRRMRAREEWSKRIKPTSEALRSAQDGVLEHLEETPGHQQEVTVRRREDTTASTTLVLRANEDEHVPRIGQRDIIAQVENFVGQASEQLNVAAAHVSPKLPSGLVELVIERLVEWHAKATLPALRRKLRVSKTARA